MKNILKISALAVCTALTCAACVQENPSVSLNGVLNPREDDCTSAQGVENFKVALVYDSNKSDAYHSWLNITNNMSTDSPWTSSGSSSTGSTLDNQPPNVNAVYIDKLYAKCISIDGDEDACNGKDTYEKTMSNALITAGNTANVYFNLSIDKLGWGQFKEAEIKLTLHYHDGGVLSGSNYETNSIYITLIDNAQLGTNDARYDDYKVIDDCIAKGGKLTPPSEDCSYKYQDGSADWDCEEPEEEEGGGE